MIIAIRSSARRVATRALAPAGRMWLSDRRGQEAPIQELKLRVEPIVRVNEPTETARARLLYQSRKRGILETDLLMSRFAEEYLPTMTPEQLTEYSEFLDEFDWDIYYWATESEARVVPDRWKDSWVLTTLKAQIKRRKDPAMRMPDL
ncbi:Flavinator of succinate dehydrogenase-domain-containing protein [Dipodascopsis tothii]|uniref:Flavinator of succinate dehydrogenase-domain-containing protein n=1 Tax=Dipodascopsis tothii TaxID=44089 RepID=UPI0034CD43AC